MASSSRSSRAPDRGEQVRNREEKEDFCNRLVFDLLEKLKSFKSDVGVDINYMKELDVENVNWKDDHCAQCVIWSQLTEEVGEVQETLADMETAGYKSREKDRNKIIKKYEEALKAQKRFLKFCERYMPPRR